jgi:nitrogen fixation NifU-like protein
VATSRYSAVTIDHFQHPRNVGRIVGADRSGFVDDPSTETTITLYAQLADGVIAHATFRTFGCSACIAASSVATELLIGRARPLTADEIDAALGGLPTDKRYCAELVAEATRRTLD